MAYGVIPVKDGLPETTSTSVIDIVIPPSRFAPFSNFCHCNLSPELSSFAGNEGRKEKETGDGTEGGGRDNQMLFNLIPLSRMEEGRKGEGRGKGAKFRN